MPPWNNQFVCDSYFINRTLQKVIDDENNNKVRQKLKIQ